VSLMSRVLTKVASCAKTERHVMNANQASGSIEMRIHALTPPVRFPSAWTVRAKARKCATSALTNSCWSTTSADPLSARLAGNSTSRSISAKTRFARLTSARTVKPLA